MSIYMFEHILKILPETLTQIAFGIGSFYANRDMKKIFELSKEKGITPNVTINGSDNIKDEDLKWLAKTCGAVAVSVYDKDEAYKKIEKLSKYGLKQINIHQIISEETFEDAKSILLDKKNKVKELEGLNAIVFLSLKQVGRGKNMTILSEEKYSELISMAFTYNISIGFDSCGAGKFLNWIKKNKKSDYEKFFRVAEPCESWLFSAYINVEGKFVPCSFCECVKSIKKYDLLKCESPQDFLDNVWNNEDSKKWRDKLSDRYAKNQYDCLVHKV